MVDYIRGDIPKKDREVLKRELERKADEVRQMVKTSGWKYLKEFMGKTIENYKVDLQTMAMGAESVEDLKKISDRAITIYVYQSLLDRTNEYMKQGE
jgi:hypothetical protein